jgi:hypothetical protein
MENFSKEISEFEQRGIYKYKFDVGGNFQFKIPPTEFTEKYLSLLLLYYIYDESKIKSFYETEFREFIPALNDGFVENTGSVDTDLLKSENESLKLKLETLSSQSNENMSEAEKLAVKQVILDLRILLKQGSSELDFSNTFPYLPLK